MAHDPKLEFYRAPVVESGDRITSTQAAQQADAISDRIRSGYGDAAQRFVYWWLNAFRQLRSGDGLRMPAQAEFFHYYQHLDPNYTRVGYPEAFVGEEEGLNLANVVNQFVQGNDSLSEEDVRLNNIDLWFGNHPPATPKEKWEVGKLQRGAYNILTNEGNTPALTAAVEPFFISSPFFSPHGKGFGGFMPTPDILANSCGATEEGGSTVPSFEIKFSALNADASTDGLHGSISTVDGLAVLTYSGSCPSWSDDTAAGHVWTIIRGPVAYYVLVNPGVWDVLPYDDWLEGPYSGNARLYRYDGGHIPRMMWAFVADYWRGTDEQRNPDTFNIQQIAFDFQAAHTRQWALSPARGVANGGGIEAIYPTTGVTGETRVPEGTFLNWRQTGTTSYHRFPGYVWAGMFYKATKLETPCAVEIIDQNDNVLKTVSLSPDADGNASDVIWFDDAISPTFVRARLKSQANFSATDGLIWIEFAELYEYKANFWDLYLLIRLASTGGGDDADLDTIDGETARASAKSLWDSFDRWGMILNEGAAGVRTIRQYLNTNPAYENFRRFSRECVKIVRRQEFVKYGVEGGKSVLWFKRWVDGLFEVQGDSFWGMAPHFEAPDEITEGEEYVVRATSGAVTYRGANYTHGQRFIGAAGYTSYATTGDAEPFVYDGIKSTALKKGYTNEWVGFISSHVEHPSESSIWKPDAYADYFPIQDRCWFYAYNMPNELHRHVDPNYAITVDPRLDGTGWDLVNTGLRLGSLVISPESVTGHRYTLGGNAISDFGGYHGAVQEEFCKSCRIYEPPFEVESCIVEPDMVNGGRDDLVKITLKSRLHSHDDAPATVDSDVSTWDSTTKSDLRAESYRTDDNTIREYMVYIYEGTHGSWKIGDSAAESYVQGLPDNPFGSIMFKTCFAKLPPKPYDDGNNIKDSHDSRMTIDASRLSELWIKAMCEGFVNGFTEQETVCDNIGFNVPYDFTFEDLCFAAFGGRSISAFGLEVREDEPRGYGPLPNTVAYADVFNRISQCVNLLTRVRIDIPLQLESRITRYEGETAHGSGCVENAGNLYYQDACLPGTTSVVDLGWTIGAPTSISSEMTFSSGGAGTYCNSGAFRFIGYREKAEFRYTTDVSSTQYQYALTPEALSLLEEGNVSVHLALSKQTSTPYTYTVGPGDDCHGALGGEACITPATAYFVGHCWDSTVVNEDLGCLSNTSGSLELPSAPCGNFYIGSDSDPTSPPESPCSNSSSVVVQVDGVSAARPAILNVPVVDP